MERWAVRRESARVNGIRIHYRRAGAGPPLYLLHGYPQTGHMWRKLVPGLAPHFELVMPDLRGYGDSDKPPAGYDKRTMAADIRALAHRLGHDRLGLVGHDRGGRVAHRYALDHGETLERLMLLDIEPTLTVFERMDAPLALAAWHWLFLPVPDLAETLIGARPEEMLRFLLRSWAGDPGAIEEEAVGEYLRCFRIPGTIRATCSDYRAGASTDLEDDRRDRERRIEAPLRVLWGGLGRRGEGPDLVEIWREKAREVSGRVIGGSGHFMPEEVPSVVVEEIRTFFGQGALRDPSGERGSV